MSFYSERVDKGFTLVELLIVVVILGILASVAIPRFFGVMRMAKEAEARSILSIIRAGQQKYYLQYSVYTDDITLLDVDIAPNPSDYYKYTAENKAAATEGNRVIGWATQVLGQGVRNYEIQVDGDFGIGTF